MTLTQRYQEALRYYGSATSEAVRELYGDTDEFTRCQSYVIWSWSDRSQQWDKYEHMEAYTSAREAGPYGVPVDVQPVRTGVSEHPQDVETQMPGLGDAGSDDARAIAGERASRDRASS